MAALLVDEGIGRDLVQRLVAQGFPAIHWLDIGRKTAHDSVVFFEAQQRHLTVFTWNRDDYLFTATCWRNWSLGDHHGVIAPKKRRNNQLPPPLLYPILVRYCQDTTSYLNRVELF